MTEPRVHGSVLEWVIVIDNFRLGRDLSYASSRKLKWVRMILCPEVRFRKYVYVL